MTHFMVNVNRPRPPVMALPLEHDRSVALGFNKIVFHTFEIILHIFHWVCVCVCGDNMVF